MEMNENPFTVPVNLVYSSYFGLSANFWTFHPQLSFVFQHPHSHIQKVQMDAYLFRFRIFRPFQWN